MSQTERQIGEVGVAEQRRWPRVQCPHGVVIQLLKDGMIGEAMAVRGQDFSTMGLGMVLETPLEVGSQFLMPLATRSGMPLPLLYTVVYCQAVGEGEYRIGAELVSMYNLDEYARGRLPHESLAEYICEGVGMEG